MEPFVLGLIIGGAIGAVGIVAVIIVGFRRLWSGRSGGSWLLPW